MEQLIESREEHTFKMRFGVRELDSF
uniref:Uncharacterized protein n=1 Tax=Lepeophtheirus salmonis TaxID=72036 RepID=A0A0K2TTW5_LEPSM